MGGQGGGKEATWHGPQGVAKSRFPTNLFFFHPQTLWEGFVCDLKINRDGRTWEVEPLNYQRDSIELYQYHLRSIYERVAVHIHALNKKIANDPRVTVNILPIGSGLTIGQLHDDDI